MNIALAGKTGSGKSTLAKSLSSKFGLDIINSDILRDYVKSRSPGWEAVERSLAAGKDAGDELLAAAINLYFAKGKGNGKYVLDNLFNVGLLEAFEKHQPLDFVFHLDISQEEATKRVKSRAREANITQHLKNRHIAFDICFPRLVKVLGQRLVKIDATKSPEEVLRQTMGFISKGRELAPRA
jgi:adenylate kinase family enzyme